MQIVNPGECEWNRTFRATLTNVSRGGEGSGPGSFRRVGRSAYRSHAQVCSNELNKQDTADAAQRSHALAYVENHLHNLFERDLPSIFSISARDGLEAKKKQNSQMLDASGLLLLEDALGQFLLAEKSSEFMLQMCNRSQRGRT